MSFSSLAKHELAHLKPRKRCCRLAELSALVKMDGSIHIRDGALSLTTSSQSPAIARKILLLLKDQFDIETELATMRPGSLKRRLTHIIIVRPQSRLAYALRRLKILDAADRIEQGIPEDLHSDPCCLSAYLRGIFLGGGSISEPTHGYHLEVATANLMFAADIMRLLVTHGFDVRLHERKKDYAVYLKEADQIEDFLALIGAHQTLLDWENVRIVRMLKEEVNRLVNFEAANLKRTASAAVEQVKDIGIIAETRGLQSLPKALREIAAARLKNPSASLQELGATLDPPLSKSAVYHRLRRIRRLASRLA